MLQRRVWECPETRISEIPRLLALWRAAAFWSLFKGSGDCRYYGLAVGLNGPTDDMAQRMAARARAQGVGICYHCPNEREAALFDERAAAGLQTDRHEQSRGGRAAYSRANDTVKGRSLASSPGAVRLDRDCREDLVGAVADPCAAEGVAPVPGSIMRGVSVPGIALAAIDSGDEPVASASSHQMLGPEFRRGTDVFWGTLTNPPDRRGEGIALMLGAMAIIHMWEVHGARGFITGVRQDNISSRRLRAKLGVTDTERMMAQCMGTEMLGAARHRKHSPTRPQASRARSRPRCRDEWRG